MENSKPFATPARYSHQSVYPTPSSTTQVKSNDSSHISSSNVKTIVESVTYSKDHLLPPPFGIHKIAGNVPKDIDITSQQDPFLNVPGDDKKKKGSVKKLSAMAVPFQPRQASNSVSVFQGVQNNVSHHVSNQSDVYSL